MSRSRIRIDDSKPSLMIASGFGAELRHSGQARHDPPHDSGCPRLCRPLPARSPRPLPEGASPAWRSCRPTTSGPAPSSTSRLRRPTGHPLRAPMIRWADPPDWDGIAEAALCFRSCAIAHPRLLQLRCPPAPGRRPPGTPRCDSTARRAETASSRIRTNAYVLAAWSPAAFSPSDAPARVGQVEPGVDVGFSNLRPAGLRAENGEVKRPALMR